MIIDCKGDLLNMCQGRVLLSLVIWVAVKTFCVAFVTLGCSKWQTSLRNCSAPKIKKEALLVLMSENLGNKIDFQ